MAATSAFRAAIVLPPELRNYDIKKNNTPKIRLTRETRHKEYTVGLRVDFTDAAHWCIALDTL
jgi:hypothetical protein